MHTELESKGKPEMPVGDGTQGGSGGEGVRAGSPAGTGEGWHDGVPFVKSGSDKRCHFHEWDNRVGTCFQLWAPDFVMPPLDGWNSYLYPGALR